MPKKVRLVGWVFLLLGAGALTILALQAQFMLLWHAYYSHFPYPGYSYAMQQVGAVAPFLTASVRSTQVARVVLGCLSGLTWWFPGRRLAPAVLALWTGVTIALVEIWAGQRGSAAADRRRAPPAPANGSALGASTDVLGASRGSGYGTGPRNACRRGRDSGLPDPAGQGAGDGRTRY